MARRAAQFARSRRDILLAIARKRNLPCRTMSKSSSTPPRPAIGNKSKRDSRRLVARRKTQPHPPELDQLWAPILTTFGALEEAHMWPAQKYLDYGNAILDSLRPGMVYVGGTDPGRFIPELMNDTGDAEPHVVITQNGLADSVYLDYLRFIYGDRLACRRQTTCSTRSTITWPIIRNGWHMISNSRTNRNKSVPANASAARMAVAVGR